MLPSGGHARAPPTRLRALDTSPAAAHPVVRGGDGSEVSDGFPPASVDMGVLGCVDRGKTVARPVSSRCATPMVDARPIPSKDGQGDFGPGVSCGRFVDFS